MNPEQQAGVVLLIMGVAFCVFLPYIVATRVVEARRRGRWIPASGSVTRTEARRSRSHAASASGDGPSGSGSGPRVYVAHYIYTAPDGSRLNGEGQVNDPRRYRAGTPIEVVVDPYDHGRSMPKESAGAPVGCMAVPGLVLFAVGAVLTYFGAAMVFSTG
ncbi:DUF3592 domain-containing protein [Tsukamurella sp. 1534]|uniref:DUF3592 domain-containing protein n=1 Tax=Tsukamurella sp. 1534 TaxID=1151061 RepID=UPI00030A1E90|nr:DUF3592 domain-containing protein [Tsukamurella sp. 1534]